MGEGAVCVFYQQRSGTCRLLSIAMASTRNGVGKEEDNRKYSGRGLDRLQAREK